MRIASNEGSADRLGSEDKRSPALPKLTDRCVAARVVIGVTGHRTLQNEKALVDQVRATLDTIKQLLPNLSRTPITFTILSPLAEGTDRLVVREALALPSSQLHVVLPLEESDYLQDFATPANIHEKLTPLRS